MEEEGDVRKKEKKKSPKRFLAYANAALGQPRAVPRDIDDASHKAT